MKQHFTKIFIASLLLVVAPFGSIAIAEDAIPDEIQALLPSDDGSSDAASEEAEFLAEFAEDDDSGVALSDADVEVVIMSDGDDSNNASGSSNSGSTNNAGGSSNNAGWFCRF